MMLKVTFTFHHPTLGFQEAKDLISLMYEGSNYQQRMIENFKNDLIMAYKEENVNNEVVYYTYWKDRESNETWTESIYNTPETLKWYTDLENAGFTWTIIKEDVDYVD